MGIEDWHTLIQYRKKWRDIVVTARTLRDGQKKNFYFEYICLLHLYSSGLSKTNIFILLLFNFI